jgi:hypothetical protein
MKGHKTLRVFLRERPAFLAKIGTFSTRILFLNQEALASDYFRYQMQELVRRKKMPTPVQAAQSEIARIHNLNWRQS